MPTSLEAIARAKKNYLLRHPDRRKASLKKYYEANKATENARARKWERDNRERFLARRRQYRRGNPTEIASVRRWQDKNPDKVRAYKANTRAKRIAVAGKLSPGIYDQLMALQAGRCAYCHKRLMHFHLDHIMPIARGGTNEDCNMQLLCRLCNQTKSARDPVEFMQSLGKLL